MPDARWQIELARMEAEACGDNPRAATEAAMTRAAAVFAAVGRAERIAAEMTSDWFNPTTANLLVALLTYAACTRDPLLRDLVPAFRRRARNAIACYRTLQCGAPVTERDGLRVVGDVSGIAR